MILYYKRALWLVKFFCVNSSAEIFKWVITMFISCEGVSCDLASLRHSLIRTFRKYQKFLLFYERNKKKTFYYTELLNKVSVTCKILTFFKV